MYEGYDAIDGTLHWAARIVMVANAVDLVWWVAFVL